MKFFFFVTVSVTFLSVSVSVTVSITVTSHYISCYGCLEKKHHSATGHEATCCENSSDALKTQMVILAGEVFLRLFEFCYKQKSITPPPGMGLPVAKTHIMRPPYLTEEDAQSTGQLAAVQ